MPNASVNHVALNLWRCLIETFARDYHEFSEPYKDKNGKNWYGFCEFEIEYSMKQDSIDYPNGLVRHIEDPVIDSYRIFNVTLSSQDGMDVVYTEDVSEEIVKFFSDQFDPEDYKEHLV
jgi:hypothetical protein